MEGIKMTNLVKKLSLSLVITTIITTNVLAKEGDLFDSSLEDSSLGSTIALKPQQDVNKELFAGPEEKQREEGYKKEKTRFEERVSNTPLTTLTGSENTGSEIVASSNPSQVVVEEDSTSSSDDSTVFTLTPEQIQVMEKVKEKNARKLLRKQNKIKDQALLRDLFADQERARQPSTLRVVGEYTYDATKTVLGKVLTGAEWVVRTRPAAYVIAYQCTGGMEELCAYGAYVGGLAVGSYTAGPQVGKQMADGAYYGTKAALSLTKAMFPYFKGGVAAATYTYVNEGINIGLDIAPEVAKTAVSAAKTVGSAVKFAAETTVSAVKTAASFVGSTSSYISSFWGK